MKITPIKVDIDLAASDLVRSPGLHMSTIYNALYADLYPQRYKTDGAFDRTRMGMGFVLEEILEDAFARRITSLGGYGAFRPREFKTAEGVAFSPDYIIDNGVTRLGESKLTWMSSAGMPSEPTTTVPEDERYGKWFCVAPKTQILRSDLTYTDAASVKAGDMLIGFDETPLQRRRFRHTRVERIKTLLKPSVRLFLEDGSTVDCSKDHQWLVALHPSSTRIMWRRADELLTTDQQTGHPRKDNMALCRVVPYAAIGWELSFPERAYLGGFADGEGSLGLTKSGRALSLTLSQKEGVVLAYVESLLKKAGYRYTKQPVRSGFGTGVFSLRLGYVDDVLDFLAICRPLRLLEKFQAASILHGFSYDRVKIVAREELGEQPVVAIETSTHTFIAEGFASHNCQMMAYCEELETAHARLIGCFVNGDYAHMRRGARKGQPPTPQLLAWDIEFTARELQNNKRMLMNYARSKGWL